MAKLIRTLLPGWPEKKVPKTIVQILDQASEESNDFSGEIYFDAAIAFQIRTEALSVVEIGCDCLTLEGGLLNHETAFGFID